MARVASNPLSLPRFRPYFQVSDTALLFKSPSLSPYRTRKFQSIACQTNPLPTQTQPSDEGKVLAEPDSVDGSTSEATTSSVGGGFREFPNKNINRRIAIGSTLAAVGLFMSSRLDFGVSLKDLSAAAVPYEEALSNGKPTVVEFYADWCEVCRELAPDIYKVEQQYRDSVNFVMLNVDNTKWEQELDEFGVEGIPHFAFLDKDGNEEGNVVGRLPRKYLQENVDALARGEASVPHARVVGQYSSAESRKVHQVVDPRSHV
ncbi:thioredoxin-like protein HCF164, chloroplastic [Gossypium australe]|uniref:Thioredoxin-like protein HCF164, chloroplastic n=1 Tax=Gossypium australe TaxID=47621 RepID=A0A5B6WPX8_9ROSI|nr:thioredoxin-like protein HCF164, chloroplastic [Gossypium australe]